MWLVITVLAYSLASDRNLAHASAALHVPGPHASQVHMRGTGLAQQGLAQTRERTGLLLMVSLLERQVYILPDQAPQGRISDDQWQHIVVRSWLRRMKVGGDLAGGSVMESKPPEFFSLGPVLPVRAIIPTSCRMR